MWKKLMGWLLLIAWLLLPQACRAEEEEGKAETTKKIDLKGAKIVMIIARQNFRDEEYKEPRELFEQSGAKIIVASSSLKESVGMLKKVKVKPDILIKKVRVKEYDAVVFVGGVGAQEYFNNKTAHRIAKKAIKEKKILAAICIAPSILANAGVLKDKKATVWESEKGNLKKKEAIYQDKDVVQDGNIITANGPKAAKKFAHTIARTLAEVLKKKREEKKE